MQRKKILLLSLYYVLSGLALAGCAKTADCNLKENHVHIYNNDDLGLKKYIPSEKKKIEGFHYSHAYIDNNPEIDIVCKNDLYLIEDNIDYLEKIISEYIVNEDEDITYSFKFYKIDDNGTLIEKWFESLDDIEEGYEYFSIDLVRKNIGKEYRLSNQNAL